MEMMVAHTPSVLGRLAYEILKLISAGPCSCSPFACSSRPTHASDYTSIADLVWSRFGFRTDKRWLVEKWHGIPHDYGIESGVREHGITRE